MTLSGEQELRQTDVVIIGGGIVGAAIAYTLSQYKVSLTLVEREYEVGWGATKANSGIVHGGFHDAPTSWKGKLCIKGNQAYPELARKLDVQFRQNGVLMVALSEDDLTTLNKYLERGMANNVPGLRILSKSEVLEKEPNLNPNVIAALYAPQGGVVNPFEMAIAMAEVAQANGTAILMDTEVTGLSRADSEILVQTTRGVIRTKYVVNAAGLGADDIARMAGDHSFSIKPRKGEEYLMDKRIGNLVTSTIFPTPKPTSKGILVIPTAEGNLMIGPTAWETDDKQAVDTTSEGFAEIMNSARALLPSLSPRDIITSFAGIRAASDRGDFILEPSVAFPGLVHAAGIESPGLTAAPAIAEVIAEILQEQGLKLEKNPEATDERPPVVRFHSMSDDERAELLRKNPRYGKIICRCETVTEGEIVDAICRGARTVDGVKFRTRAGMGRCQGGFCQPLVIGILARELGVSPTEITKRSRGSNVLVSRLEKGNQSQRSASATGASAVRGSDEW